MSRLPLLVLLLGALAFLPAAARSAEPSNKLSPEAAGVLRGAKTAILYSLEEGITAHWYDKNLLGYKVLGKVSLNEKQTAAATRAFLAAVAAWDGTTTECFNPRHALHIEAAGRRYDFILCYECRELNVCRDGKFLEEVHVTGSPKVLNAMLAAAKIPLAPSHE